MNNSILALEKIKERILELPLDKQLELEWIRAHLKRLIERHGDILDLALIVVSLEQINEEGSK